MPSRKVSSKNLTPRRAIGLERSAAFQSYYQAGMKDASKRVLHESVPEPVLRARLAVCAGVQITVRSGFALLGVSAPERLESPGQP
jgi:arginyl-tRNA synthetase